MSSEPLNKKERNREISPTADTLREDLEEQKQFFAQRSNKAKEAKILQPNQGIDVAPGIQVEAAFVNDGFQTSVLETTPPARNKQLMMTEVVPIRVARGPVPKREAPRPRWPWVLPLLLLPVGLSFFWLRQPAPPEAPPASLALAQAQAPQIVQEAPPAPRPKTVLLQLDSEPTGAEVFLQGTLIGKTPLVKEFDYAEEDLALEFTKKGFVSATLRVTPNEPYQTTVPLTPKPTPKAPPKPATKEKDKDAVFNPFKRLK